MTTPRLRAITADITQLDLDVIVNAANNSLLGGGGVDGAIHQAAGPELLAVCKTLGGCETGDAKITKGFELPAQWVVHTVGPVWAGGDQGESQRLARCYRRSLELAETVQASSVAFPAISCGVYGYPAEQAVPIAIHSVRQYFDESSLSSINELIFCCFDQRMAELYHQALA